MKEKTTFNTLRAAIRAVVDAADRRLTQAEIRTECAWETSPQSLGVTICNMVLDGQLSKRRVRKGGGRGAGVRFVYGPGKVPVEDAARSIERTSKVLGFMAMKRLREARAARKQARRDA